jgi:ParB family chromosome partitioning protein
VSRYKGLPEEKKMRHDVHFVEELLSSKSYSVGKYISMDKIDVNPFQPRKDFGDLSELVHSIKEKGVLEPILVRQKEDRFQIIAGERRYQAAKIAGLLQIPCIEIDVDDRGSLEISLVENLQRKNLDSFEEASALQKLCDTFHYTHEQIAKKLGKSRSSITEILSLNRVPENIREVCRRADIHSKSMLLQIARLDQETDMQNLIERIKDEGLTRDDAREFKKEQLQQPLKAKKFIFAYQPRDKRFSLNIRFNKEDIEREELIKILREIIKEISKDKEPLIANK